MSQVREVNEETVTNPVAENLRVAVENVKLPLPSGTTFQKTVSIGVLEFPADTDQSYKTIKYADVALYQAKNKAIRFTQDLWKDEKY